MPSDTELAARIERSRLILFRSVAEGARIAGVPGPNLLETDNATAIYAGDSSPITQVVGIKPGVDLNELTAFYQGRTRSWEAAVTPFTGAAPTNLLLRAGAVFEQFENINSRFLLGDFPTANPEVDIREVTGVEDCALWSSVVGRGFHGGSTNEVTDLLDRVSASIPNARRYLAFVNGQPAAGAALFVCGDTAFLGGASTIEGFRGQGLHSALIAHRLQEASKHSDLVVMQASPGSQSQANIQRFGFQLAYTQISLRLELPG